MSKHIYIVSMKSAMSGRIVDSIHHNRKQARERAQILDDDTNYQADATVLHGWKQIKLRHPEWKNKAELLETTL